MLIRSGGDAEPAVIGHIDDPARPFAGRREFAGENDLVANQRQRERSAGNGDEPVPVAGEKSAALFGQLLQAKPFEERLERQIFAERHQMHFVIDRVDRAVVTDDIDRVVDAGVAGLSGSANRIAPVINTAPGGSRLVICASASASRVRKNGNGDSGQIKCVAPPMPRDCGPEAPAGQRHVAVHHLLSGGVIEAHVLLQIGLHDAQVHAVNEPRRIVR